MSANGWLGLDVGGANIKASAPDGKRAFELPFPLWRMPEKLQENLGKVRDEMGEFAGVAVTMTGELCDCFESKTQGVQHIVRAVVDSFQGKEVRFWSIHGRFLNAVEALLEPLCLAASNWLALAEIVAGLHPKSRVLLLDMGSTTTDILYLSNGRILAKGRDDVSRLRSGELVYTGMTRTPLCFLEQEDVCAELFATTLDSHLILGNLPENLARVDSADGRPWTKFCAEGRLARMLGGDLDTTSREERYSLAQKTVDSQWSKIREGMIRVCHDLEEVDALVLAGQGSVWLRSRLQRDPRFGLTRVVDLESVWGADRSRAGCACAVAMLAEAIN